MRQFRIRTLMVAVAVVAVDLWVVVSIPVIGIVGAFLFVPLVGACWGGSRTTDHLGGSVSGGIGGAAVQSVILVVFRLFLMDSSSAHSEQYWAIFGMEVLILFAISLVPGTIAGLFVGVVVYRAYTWGTRLPSPPSMHPPEEMPGQEAGKKSERLGNQNEQ